jgi:LuxR family transcriptional regulator, regulator of acetate metabolism
MGTAEAPIVHADDLAAVFDAYREAVNEEQLAQKHRGHVTAGIRERLHTLHSGLRASLEEPHGEPVSEVRRRLPLLAELDSRLHHIAEQDAEARSAELVRIHESLVRLRALASPQELIEAAPGELCRACGFTRAMISRVRGSVWVPAVLFVADGLDADEHVFREYLQRTRIGLTHMLLETELVRRRVAVLVSAPASDPRTYKPIVEAARSTSYVATPIMPTDRVIGFFHADRFGQELPVSPQDRDNIWVFAEHFGLLYERATLVERLALQRSELSEALASVAALLEDLCVADFELARHEEVPEPARARRPRSQIEALLTTREREVLELMAEGCTNTQIALSLTVSEATVKSHVKRVLRKLHVSNRAQAVALYTHLIAREQQG